jgi:hypothetical protein
MRRRSFTSDIAGTCAGLCLCAALTTARNAEARDAPVSDHARRARVAYDLRDWTIAVAEYRAAYEADARSEYLFGLAQALRQSHDYSAAIFTFKAYKRSEGVTVQQATAAELLISQCEAEQTKAEAEAARDSAHAASSAEATSARSDRSGAGTTLVPAPARTDGSVFDAAPPQASHEGDRAPFYADVLGDGLFIAGLGAATVGTALLLHGNASMRQSDDAPTEGAAADRSDSAKREQAVAMVLCPVGGALVIGAIWRWLSVGSDEPQTEGISLGPGSISVYGQF